MATFREILALCNLVDLGFKGLPYTYDNKRRGRANVRVRLDRAVATSEWRDLFSAARVEHLVSPVSDHCPILVCLMQETRTTPRQPRRHYEVWWERAAELPELIASAWEEAGQKEDMGTVRKGLDNVMNVLQSWSKKKFGNLLKELDKCRKKLEELMRDNNDREAIRRISDHMNELLYREEMLWMQRLRINWLKEGDRNTKYFHQKAVWRARKNKIKCLKDDDGVWKDTPSDMERMASSYFKDLFTRDPSIEFTDLLNLLQCPHARGLWSVMREVWDLPAEEMLFEHNPDWFMHALKRLDVDQRVFFLMTMWRVWHIHNKLTHQKQPAPIEASKRFLMSYVNRYC
ncbi:hypothetical protein ACQ4PT_063618 [Festuca glaucescens]